MKTITKTRILNKLNIYSMTAFLILLFISYFLCPGGPSDFIFHPLGRGNDDNIYNLIMQEILNSTFNIYKYMNAIISYPLLIIPILPIIFSMGFFNEKIGLFVNVYPRISNYKKFIRKSILSYTFLSGTLFYIVYLVYFFIGYIFLKHNFVGNTVPQLFFLQDVFGKGFAENNPFFYFLIYGFCAFFLTGMIYGLLAIAIYFFTNKKYIATITIYFYFIIFTLLFNVVLPGFRFFSPHISFALPQYGDGLSSICILTPLLIPALISILLIEYKLFRTSLKIGI